MYAEIEKRCRIKLSSFLVKQEFMKPIENL